MKKISILIFFFLIIIIKATGQTFNPYGFLIGDTIMLYGNPKNKHIKSIIDNTNLDIFYEIQILKKKGARFLIRINPINNDNYNQDTIGWVDIKYVGVGIKRSRLNTNSLDEINIYSIPNERKKPQIIKGIVAESIIATIVDFRKEWVKIVFNYDGRIISGWLNKNNQCYDLYTMCLGG